MSDDQIRENLKEANAWRKSFDALTDEMNELLVEAAGLHQQAQDLEEMRIKLMVLKAK